jgi:hypothetical protein
MESYGSISFVGLLLPHPTSISTLDHSIRRYLSTCNIWPVNRAKAPGHMFSPQETTQTNKTSSVFDPTGKLHSSSIEEAIPFYCMTLFLHLSSILT